ncbi:hypothetical protein ES707_03149 [subsurface metagenome]
MSIPVPSRLEAIIIPSLSKILIRSISSCVSIIVLILWLISSILCARKMFSFNASRKVISVANVLVSPVYSPNNVPIWFVLDLMVLIRLSVICCLIMLVAIFLLIKILVIPITIKSDNMIMRVFFCIFIILFLFFSLSFKCSARHAVPLQ